MQDDLCSKYIVYGPFNLEHGIFFLASLPNGLSRASEREWIRALLKRLLASQWGCGVDEIEIDHQRGQAPRIKRKEQYIFLSISYTETHVAVVISDRYQVGIDIESQSNRLDQESCISTARLYFSNLDADQVVRCSPREYEHCFLRRWVAYESVYKCFGSGMREWMDAHQSLFDDCELCSFEYRDIVGAIAARKTIAES